MKTESMELTESQNGVIAALKAKGAREGLVDKMAHMYRENVRRDREIGRLDELLRAAVSAIPIGAQFATSVEPRPFRKKSLVQSMVGSVVIMVPHDLDWDMVAVKFVEGGKTVWGFAAVPNGAL